MISNENNTLASLLQSQAIALDSTAHGRDALVTPLEMANILGATHALCQNGYNFYSSWDDHRSGNQITETTVGRDKATGYNVGYFGDGPNHIPQA